MIVEIDTIGKTIRVKGTVSLKNLIDFIMKAFPDFSYQNGWSIIDKEQPNWFPITQPGIGTVPYLQPYQPYVQGGSTQPNWIGDDPNGFKVKGGLGTTTGGIQVTTGTAVVDINTREA